MQTNFRDKNLLPIWQKIQDGERLSLEDGRILFNTQDIVSLGKMAQFVQRNINGDAVYFAVNQKIEPTNICVLNCKFCNFAVKQNDEHAYQMTIQEILNKITSDIQEVHITGGLHPDWEFDFYLDMIKQIHNEYPHIGIKAFTAVEIDYFSKKFKLSIEDILSQFKCAGLSAMPGGGAEVFSERVRAELFKQKISGDRWIEIHKAAHKLGISSNATILYGHIETIEERLEHLIKLRALQDETNGFFSFIPLAFQPGTTNIKPSEQFTSAIDDLKMIVVSRLMLDNFPHIKAYWVMLTQEVASIALLFGADDIEGTVGGEQIAHSAGATSPASLTKEKLIKLIKDADKIPVERDVYYNPKNVYEKNIIGKIPYLNSVSFYENFDNNNLKLLPVTPSQMGCLLNKNQLVTGLFSLADYLENKDDLTILDYCISVRDQVKSVLLFSNYGWSELNGKNIAITEETSTSVKLLRILLKHKYKVDAVFTKIKSNELNLIKSDAVLLIGDSALKHRKLGLSNFEIIYDLATEWYQWKNLPFVFAVWAIKNDVNKNIKLDLIKSLENSLNIANAKMGALGKLHGARIKLTIEETTDYINAFNFHLGERENNAIQEFSRLIKMETVKNQQ